jgi:hypothetical protein
MAAGDRISALDGVRNTIGWTELIPGGQARAVRGFDDGCVIVTESEMCAFDARSRRLLWRQPVGPWAGLEVGNGIAVSVADTTVCSVSMPAPVRRHGR